MLWMFQRVNYGPVNNEKNRALADLQPREWLVIAPIVAMAILMGVLPNLFLRPIEPSVDRVLNRYHRGAATEIRAGFGNRDSGFVATGDPARVESRPSITMNPEPRTPNHERTANDEPRTPNPESPIPNPESRR
jgi:NADH-quinone oxidoreductase subunit M